MHILHDQLCSWIGPRGPLVGHESALAMGAAVTLQWIYTLRYEMLRCLLAWMQTCAFATNRLTRLLASKSRGQQGALTDAVIAA